MKRYWNYFLYVMAHKWFVLVASRKTGCSLWRALVHDLSKFSPSEWVTYAKTFYYRDGQKRFKSSEAFNMAWGHHQKTNKHHWEYWLLIKGHGELHPMEMPKCYIREMVADWAGAGRAISGRWEVRKWYDDNSDKMVMTNKTRGYVKVVLETSFPRTSHV